MLEYNLIENALNSLNEAIDFYIDGRKYEQTDRYKFCILLTSHCSELLLKEILYTNYPVLIYENIDDLKDGEIDNKTIGFALALKRVKKICKIDLGRYEQYLNELAVVRNRIQHFRFSIEEGYCQKIMVQSFSAIEHIVLSVLNRRFCDFDDVISQEQINYLHEDKLVYNSRKRDVIKEIQEKNLKRFQIKYISGKHIDIPCPKCSEEFLVISEDKNIICKMCGEVYISHQDLYEKDDECFISSFMEREIGRRKHLIPYDVFECEQCENRTLVYNGPNNNWYCWTCGNEVESTICCDDCGQELPDKDYYYFTAVSYTNSDNFSYLCEDCAKKLRESEYSSEYEIY